MPVVESVCALHDFFNSLTANKQAMDSEQETQHDDDVPRTKPYCVAGADSLTSHIWKQSDGQGRFRYRFNLFRILRTGTVTQLLRPRDVLSLAKFVRVISQVLVDDGCISLRQRRVLSRLAVALDELLENEKKMEAEERKTQDS